MDEDQSVIIIDPAGEYEALASKLDNVYHVTNPFKDFTVYYQDGVDLYECFPDRSRMLINETLSRLLDRARSFKRPIMVISDTQVGYLRHALANKGFVHEDINPATVDFHLMYGLISEEEYLRFKQTNSKG